MDEFVRGLRAIALRDFTLERVADYMAASPVDPATLGPHVAFTPTHYTRNLIDRSQAYELMAICWEVGQSSRIHNHQGQRCWMAVPVGRLAVQNYEVLRQDPQTGSCELREADRLEMDPAHPSHVRPDLPVHAVLNLPEYGERAVSLHVYSLPYDRCLVYNRQNNTYCEVPLFFDREYGEPT
ncbi:MAG TPA: cysteine dioxygenase family protein [Vicinamibacteria bacterium]